MALIFSQVYQILRYLSIDGFVARTKSQPYTGGYAEYNGSLLYLGGDQVNPSRFYKVASATTQPWPAANAYAFPKYGLGLVHDGGDNIAVVGTTDLNANRATMHVSNDGGTTWSARALPLSRQWNSVAYGNGTFVVVGANYSTYGTGSIAYSKDGGRTWPAVTGSYFLSGVTFACGYFWGHNYGSRRLFRSADGINWTSVNLPSTPSGSARELLTANGRAFVELQASSDNTVQTGILTSTDGVNWVAGKIPNLGNTYVIRSVYFALGKYYALRHNASYLVSDDGVDWTAENSGGPIPFYGLYISGQHVWFPSSGNYFTHA